VKKPRLIGDDERELLKYDRTGGGLHLLRAYVLHRRMSAPVGEVLPKILAALDPILIDLVQACESDGAKDDRSFLDLLRTALRIKGANSPAKSKQEATRRKIAYMWYSAYLDMNSDAAEFRSGRTIARDIAKELDVSLRTVQDVWAKAKKNRPVYASLESDATKRAQGKR
jgi:hypothetical protein